MNNDEDDLAAAVIKLAECQAEAVSKLQALIDQTAKNSAEITIIRDICAVLLTLLAASSSDPLKSLDRSIAIIQGRTSAIAKGDPSDGAPAMSELVERLATKSESLLAQLESFRSRPSAWRGWQRFFGRLKRD